MTADRNSWMNLANSKKSFVKGEILGVNTYLGFRPSLVIAHGGKGSGSNHNIAISLCGEGELSVNRGLFVRTIYNTGSETNRLKITNTGFETISDSPSEEFGMIGRYFIAFN